MPEGHTLHRLARRHKKFFAGRPVRVSSPQGRFALAASAVDGRVLQRAEAYGKHLFHVYGPDAIVHVHLGLIGTFSEQVLPETPPVGQVRMRLVGQDMLTDLRGPSACELMNAAEMAAIVARLGPDPLRRRADPSQAWARLSRSKLPVAALLMDQKVLAGVGNVYRAEILFRHGLNPLVPGRDLDHALWLDMWQDLVTLMRAGVRDQPDRHGPRGTPTEGHGPSPTPGPPRRRGVRLPSHRHAVPGVRYSGGDVGPGGPQPLLVPDLPGLSHRTTTFSAREIAVPAREIDLPAREFAVPTREFAVPDTWTPGPKAAVDHGAATCDLVEGRVGASRANPPQPLQNPPKSPPPNPPSMLPP